MDVTADSEETNDRVLSDWSHLPGGHHDNFFPELCSCIWCVGERARAKEKQTVAEFVAANADWREYARGWSGL